MFKFGLCTLRGFILPSFKILMTCRRVGTTAKDIVDALITWGSVLITARFFKNICCNPKRNHGSHKIGRSGFAAYVMKGFKPAGCHSMCLTVLKKTQICELTQIFFP